MYLKGSHTYIPPLINEARFQICPLPLLLRATLMARTTSTPWEAPLASTRRMRGCSGCSRLIPVPSGPWSSRPWPEKSLHS